MPDYREPTDEVIEAVAEPVQELPPQSQQVARGGGIIPAPAHSGGSFVDLLEDGQLSYDMHEQLKEVAAQMRAVANSTGGKAKGELTLKLKLSCEGDAFHIEGDIKTKMPDLPRRRSIMWQDDGGAFTRFPPKQTQMFGTAQVRRVG